MRRPSGVRNPDQREATSLEKRTPPPYYAYALFALFFVGIRHATYACYYTLANGELVRKDPSIETKLPGAVSPNRTFIARWSGVSFYSLLILGLSLLAVMMLWKG
jgi:hypothetical protein